MAHQKRHRLGQRQSHRPLRRQTLPPRHRARIQETKNPHGHRRQPHHHITSCDRRNHHRALHRHSPRLPKALLEKRRPTPRPKTRKTGTPEQKRLRCRFVNDVATDLSSMSRLMTMEPTTGIEPAPAAWEAAVLPLNYVGTARLHAPAYYTPRPSA